MFLLRCLANPAASTSRRRTATHARSFLARQASAATASNKKKIDAATTTPPPASDLPFPSKLPVIRTFLRTDDATLFYDEKDRTFKPAIPTTAASTEKEKKKKKRGTAFPKRIGLLQIEPTSVIWEAIQEKCKGGTPPFLGDYHILLQSIEKTDNSADADKHFRTYVMQGLALFTERKVNLQKETISLFFSACQRLKLIGKAVDVFLDSEKRLGFYINTGTLYRTLLNLSKVNDTERLLKLFDALPSLRRRYTASIYYLVIDGLIKAGQMAQAEEIKKRVPPAFIQKCSHLQEVLQRSASARPFNPYLLRHEPTAVIWKAIKGEWKNGSVHIEDYHIMLNTIRKNGKSVHTHTHTHPYTCMIEGISFLNERKVNFPRDTTALFLYACEAVGMLGEGVDVLLDKEQRLWRWATRPSIHFALEELGKSKDTERMLKLFDAMPECGLEHKERTYVLVLKGLTEAGELAQAEEILKKAGPLGLHLLRNEPTAIYWKALKERWEGGAVNLYYYHTMLIGVRKNGTSIDTHTHTHPYTCILEALSFINERKVDFLPDTPALFLYACEALGMLGEGVDVLLDKEQRLWRWAMNKPVNFALEKLGKSKDTERMLKLFEAMSEWGLEHKESTYFLVLKGLIKAGELAQAREIAEKAPPALIQMGETQDLLVRLARMEDGGWRRGGPNTSNTP